MSQVSVETAKANLLERKADLEDRIGQMSTEIRAVALDEADEGGSLGNHHADDGSNVFEGMRLSTISADLEEMLAQVNGALGRIEAGSFGICLRCQQPIGEERLEAFPYVAYCINCQSIIERELSTQAAR